MRPRIEWKASVSSACEAQSRTPSLPIASHGFTMAGHKPSASIHSRMALTSSERNCRGTRTPQSLARWIIRNLFRRAGLRSVPLPGNPRAPAKRSAKFTPLSEPGITWRTSMSRNASMMAARSSFANKSRR